MKRTVSPFLCGLFGKAAAAGLAVLAVAVAGCSNGSPLDLSMWAGTWKAVDQYLDNSELNSVWTGAAAAIQAAEPNAAVSANAVKGAFKVMLKTDFKSCVIAEDTIKIFNDVDDATGVPNLTVTYTFAGIHTVESEEGNQDWYKFISGSAGIYRYLILGPTHQDSPDAMLHFHLQYSAESFAAAAADPNWVATVTPSSTTVAKIAADLAGFPWAMFAPLFLPPPN